MSDSNRTLLIIDDNLFFADKLKHQATDGGYQPVMAMAESFIDPALDKAPPSAIVVNMDAERFDPAAVIRNLRTRDEIADTPILAFAGHVKPELFQEGREAGATMVVSNGEISGRLITLLDTARTQAANTSQASD